MEDSNSERGEESPGPCMEECGETLALTFSHSDCWACSLHLCTVKEVSLKSEALEERRDDACEAGVTLSRNGFSGISPVTQLPGEAAPSAMEGSHCIRPQS